MKKLLVYANYYYPEVASLSQLCTDLCNGLKSEYDITVICAVPCYTGEIDDKYLEKPYYYENYDGVKVIRVRVPKFNKQSKKSRVKHIVTYFFRSILATFKAGKYDIVFTVSQPPVLGGLLGVAGKIIGKLQGRRVKMVYNIQDYNPEQTIAVGYSKNKTVLSIMMMLDKFSCKCADKVIVVGRDMVDTMKKRFTDKSGKVSRKMPKTVFINNWMDEKEVYPLGKSEKEVAAFRKKYSFDDKFVIMYSGNIGLFYDLENLIKVIEKFKDNDKVVFPFVGAGTLKSRLEEYCSRHDMTNVIFIPYQDKDKLIYSLNAADVHWVVNAEGIKGVSCPSKLYGVLAAGKPVLGVLEEGTEARNIIEETGCGYVVSPKDYAGIEKLIKKYLNEAENLEEMGMKGRKYLEQNLAKNVSIEKYKKELDF